MKKSSIVLSLFVIVTGANAQELTDSTKKSTEVPAFKRNEISINTAPVFRLLLNSGETQATRFSATYKRNLSCKSALRFSVMADMVRNDTYYPNYWGDAIILQTDTVLIKQTTVTPAYVSPHVNIGYERLFGKHKLKWFYGADVILGYSQSRAYKQNKTLVRDTTLGPNAWVEAQTFQADIVSKTTTKAYSVGISPFFGAKYPISKRFSISAQVGADMTFQNKQITETTSASTKNYNVSVFDFNQSTGIINDISLIYKF
ncbi:MAG: hypothetical protein IPP64_09640 [Bacteroidetes bacterium]|nr:hypothetical protein [Bacteroidota bacterium]